jgi:5'-nucleotidase (lipoprotein e(P4) family)
MRSRNYFLVVCLVAFSVTSTYLVTSSFTTQGARILQGTTDTEYQVAALLYMQKAGEYRALAYQAFNIARWQLDADLDKKNVKKLPKADRNRPRAIMVDIDETLLDNSPAQAYSVVHQIGFNLKDWYAWGEMRKAKPIPGAVDFINYATDHSVKVFFATNRDDVQKQATIDNLKSVGFKDVTPENVMLRTETSSKEPRRQLILQKYRIVLSVGDNLDDHSVVFEHKPIADRFAEVDKAKDLFGKKYILLPNPVYGTWENALYDYKNLSDAEKIERRRNALELP